jgi:hypothetical protein
MKRLAGKEIEAMKRLTLHGIASLLHRFIASIAQLWWRAHWEHEHSGPRHTGNTGTGERWAHWEHEHSGTRVRESGGHTGDKGIVVAGTLVTRDRRVADIPGTLAKWWQADWEHRNRRVADTMGTRAKWWQAHRDTSTGGWRPHKKHGHRKVAATLETQGQESGGHTGHTGMEQQAP